MSRVKIRCSLCRDAFPWDLKDGYPTHCKCCGEFIGIPDDAPEVAAPYISTAQKRGTTDAIYRDMEKKSEIRAQLAAEQSGMSAADVSHLKITNMKDNLREGDTAFSSNMTAEAQQMDRNAQFGAPLGMQAAAGTNVGPEARAGSRAIHGAGGLRQMHSRKYNAPVTEIRHIPTGPKNA